MRQKLNRRQFLVGTGGFTLALPFLPSLVPRSAFSAEPLPQFSPRFVAMATEHGGIWGSNMYPPAETLTQTMSYAGHEVQAGTLQRRVQQDRALLSPVLSADANRLTEQVVRKMNILRGLDIPFYIGHHTGGHLGNFARNNGNDHVKQFPRPTIDQVMAWSDAFYPNLSGVLERSMSISNVRKNTGLSYNYANPSERSGEIQPTPTVSDSLNLFNRIFVPDEDPAGARPPVVDRVLENYKRLRDGNRRLSAIDRQRLDNHMERIYELQRRLNATVSCGDIDSPSTSSREIQREHADYNYNPSAMRTFFQLHNDVVAAAFACGTSRVAVMHCRNTFSDFQGDWHQDVAHQAKNIDGAAQTTIAQAHQRFFEDVFLDLVHKLDVDEYPGVTILDNSLVMWTQESGNFTHHSYSIPIVTAGSARGFFRTGQLVDYRNYTKTREARDFPEENQHPGLIYNQWLGNVLQAVGVPRSEYERDGVGGYGVLHIGTEGWNQKPDFYLSPVQNAMGDLLPFITS